ncbi:MAG: energy transducer TonB, partial [Bacteroidota bacterium]
QAKSSIEPGQLVAPVEIPEEISDEELMDIGIEGGIEGGVEGGVVGGVLGGVVGGILGGVVGEIEAPIRAIGEIKPPRLIKRVEPLYPEIARQARVEGVVIIEATTDMYGRVQTVKVLRSIPLLDQVAIDAVRQWVYEPMVINGRPRGVVFTVTVRFKLK